MLRLPSRIWLGGLVYLAAASALAITQARLGTVVFFACAVAAAAAYAAVLASVWRSQHVPPNGAFVLALAFAVAFRVVLAMPTVNAGNDMFRYVWDGRVQRMGYNPYLVTPADPALAATHWDDNTRLMPSRRARTPYPPAAELFFRAAVSLHDSVRAMKIALIACDLATIALVWRWLAATGRSEWLTLAYAWNPLVVLEVAHSGHIDVLSAMWICCCAYLLARRRTALASAAFAMAVAAKLLPIVVAPMLWRRVPLRDALIGLSAFALVCLPFARATNPLAAVNTVIEHVRFNGPVFLAISNVTAPRVAAAIAVGIGAAAAIWCRRKLRVDDPGAWAWPMAVSLACAPVVYPWYLLSITPFLVTRSTLPLTVWTLSVFPIYVVWEIALGGRPWIVPMPILIFEYGTVVGLLAIAWWRRVARRAEQ